MAERPSRALSPARTVVLVQPDNDNRDMYSEFLHHKGLTTVAVATAEEALRAASTADVVVTGIMLPGQMDGLELVRELRADEKTRTMPIIVLTACAWTTERERAERAGCDVFLPKPCAPDELVRHIFRLATATRLRSVAGRAAGAHAKRRHARRPA